MAEVRVVVGDPEVLIRSLLRIVLSQRGLHVVGEAAASDELCELAASERPDVVVTSDQLADGALLDVVGELTATGARILVIGRDAAPERITHLLQRGAMGYLLRDSAPEQVADAVEALAAGDVALHPSVARTLLDQWRRLRGGSEPAGPAQLTPRELDVLVAMSDGLAAKAIARRLGVAVKTVENHKIRVFDKLGVRTHAQAVAVAIGHGLLADAAPAGRS